MATIKAVPPAVPTYSYELVISQDELDMLLALTGGVVGEGGVKPVCCELYATLQRANKAESATPVYRLLQWPSYPKLIRNQP